MATEMTTGKTRSSRRETGSSRERVLDESQLSIEGDLLRFGIVWLAKIRTEVRKLEQGAHLLEKDKSDEKGK